ncbi:MAG: hypothetical protein M3N93_10700 [Acidobacteriota bacterium]|nr:hypothetical protein [Acidobacteriota bacterium]
MAKSWTEMTPAERMADRIAKNREIDLRVSQRPVPEKKASGAASRQKPVRNVLDKFQEIRKAHGVDAAAEYVRSRKS